MKKVIDTIKSFFENNDWKYNFNDEDKVFSSGIDMGNICLLYTSPSPRD